MIYNKLPFAIVAIFLFSACSAQKNVLPSAGNLEATKAEKPLNVILLIGDGMGLSQVSTAFYYQQDHLSNFPRFKQIGLINTSSYSHKITDSAAGATAFACGVKTYNGSIGLSADSAVQRNITEILSQGKEMKTGIISTSSVTHATPACFYAHVPYRKMEFDIAKSMAGSDIDFFAGGGKKFFRSELSNLESVGFMMDTTSLPTASSVEWDENKRYGYLLAENGMPRMLDGRGSFLADATLMALDYLSKADHGFFLMVEGSQIDWGGHENNYDYLATELLDFDETIGKALDFADKDQNTLVIVLADHETGGLTLGGKAVKNGDKMSDDYGQIQALFSTGGHSTTLIPVFAYGPGAENFQGIYQNNEVFHKILQLLGRE